QAQPPRRFPRGPRPGFRGGMPSPPSPPSSSSQSQAAESKSEGEKKSEEKKPEEKKETKEEEAGPIFVVVPEKRDGEELISFSFDQADIDDVLKFLAEASGKVIYKDPEVVTKVTIVSMAKVTVADAFRVLAGLLSVKGYTMAVSDEDVRITTKRKGQLAGGIRVEVGDRSESIKPGDEIITQIIPIKFVDAVKLKEDLSPLFPEAEKGKEAEGMIIANADTNTIVIIDAADRVKRIVEIIEKLDQDTSETLKLEVIPLEYAEAESVAQIIQDLFKEEPTAGLPADVRRRIEEAVRRGGAAAASIRGMLSAGGLTKLRGTVKVASDERTNSVVVSASEDNLRTIKELIKGRPKLDEQGKPVIGPDGKPVMEFPGLDVDMAPKVTAKVFPLEFAEATTVAEQLNQLFESEEQYTRSRSRSPFSRYYGYYRRGGEQRKAPSGLQENRIVADTRTNSIIVTATEENMPAFEQIIKQLDAESAVSNVVRVFELNNTQASTVADVLYDLFQGTDRRRSFFFYLFGSATSGPGKGPLDLLRDVNIIAEDQSNTLLVTGPPQTFDLVEQLVEALDKPQPQVFIEVVIVDVTLDKDEQFGIEWTAIDTDHFGHESADAEIGADFDVASRTTGFRYSVLSQNFQSLLQALQSDVDVEVVSTPHITVMDNTEATISIGESIPYQASLSETAGGTTLTEVGFQDVAIELTVTPHINSVARAGQRKEISLDVSQTINSLIDIDPVLRAPRTASRSAETSVVVLDGQTVVIGGIMSDRDSLTIKRVPILSKIPWIGNLFKSKEKQRQKTELMVFLTPHVIADAAEGTQVFEQQSEKLRRNPFEREELQPVTIEHAPTSTEEGSTTPAPKAP
ncbi:MAG: secretin N-terminal domain-containing protein, partial [Armatimonadota bacterium]